VLAAMNLLFLSTENPFPEDHGHHIRTANVLKFLSRQYRIHFVGFAKSAEEVVSHPELDHLCSTVDIFQAPYSQSRLLLALSFLKSLLLCLPFTAYRYFDRRAANRIMQLIDQEEIDLIHIDMLHLAIYEKYLRAKPAILTNHNVEFLRLQRWMQIEKKLGLKVFLFWQSRLMRRFEKKMCASFAKCIAVSDVDRLALENICQCTDVEVIPNGVDVIYFKPSSIKTKFKALVWVGAMTNAYNRDAVLYFAGEIWPFVKRSLPEAKVIFAGADPPDLLQELAEKDAAVCVTGYLDDARSLMIRPNIFIAPLLSGSGTKIKVLNAMAMGIPVITTSIGIEGIEAVPGEDVLIADDAHAFAERIMELWQNPEKGERIGEQGRRLIREKYDWNIVFRRMETLYYSVVS